MPGSSFELLLAISRGIWFNGTLSYPFTLNVLCITVQLLEVFLLSNFITVASLLMNLVDDFVSTNAIPAMHSTSIFMGIE